MINIKTEAQNKFEVIRKAITQQDKIEASKKLDITLATIDKYLEGNGDKISTTEELLSYFTDLLVQRKNNIEGALSEFQQ